MCKIVSGEKKYLPSFLVASLAFDSISVEKYLKKMIKY